MSTMMQEDLSVLAHSSLPWEEMAHSTVLITGATGLLGSFLVRTLAEVNRVRQTDIRILALVRSAEKGQAVFAQLQDDPHFSLVVGDIRDRLDISEPVDFLLHTASITNSKQMVTFPVETILTTVEGTDRMLALAKEKQCRSMVYISSMEMYGRVEDSPRRVGEADYGYIDCLNIRSSYSEGKRMAECLCASYAKEYQVPVKIARLAQTFGAGVPQTDTRVFAQFAHSLLDNTDIVLHSTGESVGNYCYTRDCVSGIFTILLKGANGEAYNVNNERACMEIREMAQMIADMSGQQIRVAFDIPEDALTYGYAPPTRLRLSAEKLSALGWQAEVDLPDMYRRMMADWQQSS